MKRISVQNDAGQIRRKSVRIPIGFASKKHSDSPLKIVLAKLANVQPCGEQWSARCPAHADSNNSLSIGEGANGQVLIHCHAGCTFDQIAHTLKMHPSAFFKKGSSGRITTIREFRTLRRKGQYE